MNQKQRTEFLERFLGQLFSAINAADAKASLILAIVTAMMGLLVVVFQNHDWIRRSLYFLLLSIISWGIALMLMQ